MIRRGGGAVFQLYSSSVHSKLHQLAVTPEYSTWSLFGSLFRRPLRSSAQQDDKSGQAAATAVGGDEEASSLDGEQVDAGQDKAGQAAPAGATSADDMQAALEERDAQLKEAEENAAAMKERVTRTLADMQNLRTRTAQQMEETRQFALQGFAKDILDVADNLERALDSVPAELLQVESSSEASPEQLAKNLQSLHNGVALSQKIMYKVFKDNGLEPVECEVGQDFDPNQHNAMFELPTAEVADGKVAAIIKRGWSLKGRVIRATDVGIGRPAE